VQPEIAEEWRIAGSDWLVTAVERMRQADKGLVWTYERRDDAGQLLWIVFMNSDGLGSSRLLLTEELQHQFPEGYYVALPDRSCGMAISTRTAWDGLSELREMVTDMHRNATTPMCPDIRDPEALAPRAA